MLHFRKQGAFTLIELLIVVAIIAILAAIAVPNFLEAQTRAKVSRAKSDMRTLATALESYYVDNNNYVPPADLNSEHGANEAFAVGAALSAPQEMLDIIDANMGVTWLVDYLSGGENPADVKGEFKDIHVDLFGTQDMLRHCPFYTIDNWTTWAVFNRAGSFSSFSMLSSPIAYISDPYLRDPWLDKGASSYIKYVGSNKFMPIGFKMMGGDVTSGPKPDTRRWTPTETITIPMSFEPSDEGPDDFNGLEDSQVLWWALYAVGPDKTDSVVVKDPDSNDDIRMSMMDMWASSWDHDDADPDDQGTYLLDDGEIAEIVGAHVYDPTNGTKSGGEIWRLGGGRPADNTTNSDGDIMIDNSNGNDNEAYSVSSQVYQNLSKMVK